MLLGILKGEVLGKGSTNHSQAPSESVREKRLDSANGRLNKKTLNKGVEKSCNHSCKGKVNTGL